MQKNSLKQVILYSDGSNLGNYRPDGYGGILKFDDEYEENEHCDKLDYDEAQRQKSLL